MLEELVVSFFSCLLPSSLSVSFVSVTVAMMMGGRTTASTTNGAGTGADEDVDAGVAIGNMAAESVRMGVFV